MTTEIRTDWRARAIAAHEAEQAHQAQLEAERVARIAAEAEEAKQKRLATIREKLTAFGIPSDGVTDEPVVVDGVRFGLRYARDAGAALTVEAPCPECGEVPNTEGDRDRWTWCFRLDQLGHLLTDWLPRMLEQPCYRCNERRYAREHAAREAAWEREHQAREADEEAVVANTPTTEERFLSALRDLIAEARS